MANVSFISLREARNLPELNVDGKRVDIKTLWRWTRAGVRGGTLKLASYRIGGKIVTTRSAVAEFLAALNAGGLPRPDASARVARARRELAAK